MDLRDRQKNRNMKGVYQAGIFRVFFENSAMGMSITRPDGSISTNQSYRDLIGYTEEELDGITWMSLTHPDDLAHDREVIKPLLNGEKSTARWQKRYIHKSGRIIWVDLSTAVQRDPHDGIPFFITTVSDITEQKRLQHLLEQSESMLRESQEIASLGTYDFDMVGGIWTSSEIMDRIFGIGPDYVRSLEGWAAIIHPDHRQEMIDYVLNDVIGRKIPFNKEYKIGRISDGEEGWLHGRGRLEFDAAGNPVRLLGTITDITESKFAEQTQRQSDQKLRVLADNISGFIAYVNAVTLEYEFVNTMFEKSFGIPKDQIIGSHIRDIIGEENYRFALPYVEIARSGVSTGYENVFNLVSGPRWIRVNYTPVAGSDGVVTSLVVHSYDITDRKNFEIKLTEGAERVELHRSAITSMVTDESILTGTVEEAMSRLSALAAGALKVARTGIWLMSADATELYCSCLFDQGGVSLDSGSTLKVADYPIYFNSLRAQGLINASDAVRDPRTLEFSGEYHPAYGITSMLDAAIMLDGTLAGVVCFEHTGDMRTWLPDEEAFAGTVASLAAQVITNQKRRQSEEALRDSQERYRLLMETLPDGVIVHIAGKIVFANPASAKLIGAVHPRDLIGTPVFDFLHPDYRQMALERITASLRTGTMLPPAEEQVIRFDGTVLDVEIAAVPITFSGQRAMLTVISNITNRKEAERHLNVKNQIIQNQNEEYRQLNEELSDANVELVKAKDKAEESDKLKTAFLANMSHEIRTPLNSIIGFSDLLGEEGNNPEDVIRYSGIIRSSGNRLLDLISNLIDISKIESGTERVRLSRFQPAALLREIVAQALVLPERKKISIISNIPPAIAERSLCSDAHKVHQILTNLLNNALKFTDEGEVEVGLAESGPDIQFYVRDTGIGIPENLLGRVFDRFYQVDASTVRRFEGAGIGLSLCKAMTELLGGKIRAESEVGVGSLFTFSVPDRS